MTHALVDLVGGMLLFWIGCGRVTRWIVERRAKRELQTMIHTRRGRPTP